MSDKSLQCTRVLSHSRDMKAEAWKYEEKYDVLGFLVLWRNTMTKKQVGEERVYLTYTCTSLFIIQRSQDRNSNRAGTWRQASMQRLWKGTSYCLVPHGFLSCFLIEATTTSPGMAPPRVDWGLLHWLLIKKVSSWPIYSPIYGGTFSIEVPSSQTLTCVKLT